jgi:hypothetical protein
MTNRILQVELLTHRAIPAAAEIRIRVTAEYVNETTEVCGRLMGPRCPYATTVEVAYPFRSLPGPGLAARAVIPEASLWDPTSPFLYEGVVELWQDGQRAARARVSHGLRTLSLGPRGCHINGRPIAFRAREITATPTEEQAEFLHRDGTNLLIGSATPQLLDIADRFGFLVLGRGSGGASILNQLTRPSWLGLLIGAGEVVPLNGIVGLDLSGSAAQSLPFGLSFVVATPPLFKKSSPSLPVLYRGEADPIAVQGGQTILGSIVLE